jgi:hypothetical protein
MYIQFCYFVHIISIHYRLLFLDQTLIGWLFNYDTVSGKYRAELNRYVITVYVISSGQNFILLYTVNNYTANVELTYNKKNK